MFEVAGRGIENVWLSWSSTLRVCACGAVLLALGSPALAGTKVAVIDGGTWLFPESHGQLWCSFLNQNGFQCTLFPESGPTSSLDEFSVVIDMSSEWTDSGHVLAEVMNSARGVITWGIAPQVLGIDTDPTVREWIGANASDAGTQGITTTASDSILGDIVPGTLIEHTGKFGAWAVEDTAGHANAKVLARHNSGSGAIALMRNRAIGQSVYFSNAFTVGPPVDEAIILRAVQELSVPVIPATSPWGSVAMILGICAASAVLLRRSHRTLRSQTAWGLSRHGRTAHEVLGIAFLGGLLFGIEVQSVLAAEIVVGAAEGLNTLQMDDAAPFYSTERPIQDARLIEIDASITRLGVWNEVDAVRVPQSVARKRHDRSPLPGLGCHATALVPTAAAVG